MLQSNDTFWIIPANHYPLSPASTAAFPVYPENRGVGCGVINSCPGEVSSCASQFCLRGTPLESSLWCHIATAHFRDSFVVSCTAWHASTYYSMYTQHTKVLIHRGAEKLPSDPPPSVYRGDHWRHYAAMDMFFNVKGMHFCCKMYYLVLSIRVHTADVRMKSG